MTDTMLKNWHHAPSHLFTPGAAYIITAGTYQKEQLFNTSEKLDLVQSILFTEAKRFKWNLQAWAVMSNHYHFVAHSPDRSESLADMIRSIHSRTAVWLNRQDGTPGRKVWFEYWDTCLTHEKSYLTRLHYVHTNPVKHGIVKSADDYPWYSMTWFKNNSERSFYRTVLSFKTDKISIKDDF